MVYRKRDYDEDMPKNPEIFFPWLKKISEQAWESKPLKDEVYGFQIQAGTKWNPGLTTDQIAHYEADIGFAFPEIFKQYLQTMNGTDTPALNIYGRCGEPPRNAPGFYAYPKDLAKVREMIQWIYESGQVTPVQVEEETIPHIMPIIGHRFLVVDRNPGNPVLSMYGDDIIPYSANLMNFLVDEIFFNSRQDPHLPDNLSVKFWFER